MTRVKISAVESSQEKYHPRARSFLGAQGQVGKEHKPLTDLIDNGRGEHKYVEQVRKNVHIHEGN